MSGELISHGVSARLERQRVLRHEASRIRKNTGDFSTGRCQKPRPKYHRRLPCVWLDDSTSRYWLDQSAVTSFALSEDTLLHRYDPSAHSLSAKAFRPGLFARSASICSTINFASRATPENRPEPQVYCQGKPRKYKPETVAIPR